MPSPELKTGVVLLAAGQGKRFGGGKLTEVRLHPIELTYNVRMAQRGLPRLASPEAAQRILERLQELSAPLGTTILIEGDVGIIRP